MILKLKPNSSISDVVEYYLTSKSFCRLKGSTQKEYEGSLKVALGTHTLLGKKLGDTRLNKFKTKCANHLYEQWLDRGVSRANKISTIMSIIFNKAISLDIMYHNPMIGIDRVPNPPRKVMWTPDQVYLFLDTAYSEWKWRSIGLIVHMAYEWGQRLGDMRLMTWDKIDLDKQRMDLTQSKRNADVHLPISDELMHILKQQDKSFGFQSFVAPQINPSDGSYKPYRKGNISTYINSIKQAADLPAELTAMDMRRTAITEMVEAGVDVTQIKQVSGHKNIRSLDPYIKHTFSGASSALAQRQAHKVKEET